MRKGARQQERESTSVDPTIDQHSSSQHDLIVQVAEDVTASSSSSSSLVKDGVVPENHTFACKCLHERIKKTHDTFVRGGDYKIEHVLFP